MTALRIICAVGITSLVLPQRSFVQAVPHPSPEPQGGETESQANQETAGSIGQVALQHPELGLEGLPQAGIGILGNITTGTKDAGSMTAPMTSAQLAQALNLTSHWVAPFPPPGSRVQTFDFIADKWQLWHSRLYGGEEGNLHFINDPFMTSNSSTGYSNNGSVNQTTESGEASTVLKVDYQSGTYRQGGPNSSGGSTFFPCPMELQTSSSKSILLSYDVSFDYNFDFVKGGKLPGIFYGNEERDCSGGNLSNDGQCFSVRMMWRENGMGEVYAYLPTSNNLCPVSTNGTTSSPLSGSIITRNDTDIICNSDYGTSLGRGKFSFSRGIYTTITMYIALNSAPNVKDGIVQIWAGDVPAVDLRDLVLSSGNGTDSTRNSMKIFFSTFFGGSTPDWASRVDTSTYFRNLEIYTDASGPATSDDLESALSKKDRDEKNHAPPSLHDRTHAIVIMTCYLMAVLGALYL